MTTCLRNALMGSLLLTTSAFATPVTISFGLGTGIVSAWQSTSNSSNSTVGVAIANPILLHAGELQVTGSGGNLFCAQGVVAGTCGTGGGLTTGTAYGLGVGNGRVDGTES